jgi:hypothetical protein
MHRFLLTLATLALVALASNESDWKKAHVEWVQQVRATPGFYIKRNAGSKWKRDFKKVHHSSRSGALHSGYESLLLDPNNKKERAFHAEMVAEESRHARMREKELNRDHARIENARADFADSEKDLAKAKAKVEGAEKRVRKAHKYMREVEEWYELAKSCHEASGPSYINALQTAADKNTQQRLFAQCSQVCVGASKKRFCKPSYDRFEIE